MTDLFESSIEVIDMSEDKDRSGMSDEVIKEYLYTKLQGTSVTIVLLTPEAINYKKDSSGKYDDWLYDEVRYSLEDRTNNRTNGIIALYTDESESMISVNTTHTCSVCNSISKVANILEFENLVRKNMMNIKMQYKKSKCENVFDSMDDSYISLVHIDSFRKDYKKYIDSAFNKRSRIHEIDLVKKL